MKIDDVKTYLRVDHDEENNLIEQIMLAAEDYIVGAVGKYDESKPKARLLYWAIVQDLYDNRMLMITEAQKKRMSYTFSSIILQLQYSEGTL